MLIVISTSISALSLLWIGHQILDVCISVYLLDLCIYQSIPSAPVCQSHTLLCVWKEGALYGGQPKFSHRVYHCSVPIGPFSNESIFFTYLTHKVVNVYVDKSFFSVVISRQTKSAWYRAVDIIILSCLTLILLQIIQLTLGHFIFSDSFHE